VNLIPGITLVPILHGRTAFGTYVRNLCNSEKFDCIAVDLPEPFSEQLYDAVTTLPFISAVTATRSIETTSPVYYIPTDPCDATIEGIRQAQQNHIPCQFIGYPELYNNQPLPPLPDAHAVNEMGFDEFTSLCIHTIDKSDPGPKDEMAAQYIAYKLHELRTAYNNILVLIHFRHILPAIHHFKEERTHNLSFPRMPDYIVQSYTINPDHLYFALGELPFITGIIEKERQDIFAQQVNIVETIKDLFCHTRDNYFDNRDDAVQLSPVRIQNGLTFLRNLTIMDNCLIPSLFDIVASAKGIGGNAFALRILKSAKYYPYFPVTQDQKYVSIGINKLMLPGKDIPDNAINILKDTRSL
jgi:hypothetical protein